MDTSSLAKRVVNESLQVTKSDNVQIYCNRQTIDLAERIALECRKAAAHTSLVLWTDALYYDLYLERPVEFLETPDAFDLASLDVASVLIDLSGIEDPSNLERIAPERLTALGKGGEPYNKKLLKTQSQLMITGLGLVTPQRARAYGFDYNAWKENSYVALDVDYAEMRRLGAKLRKSLEAAKEIHIASAAGIDLSARVEGGPVRVDDGVTTRKESERSARAVELPGGSVTVVPDVTSVRGAFVSDVALPLSGKLVKGTSWKFEKGIVTSFEGKENIKLMKGIWTVATGEKNRFGFIQLGLNPNAKPGFLYSHVVRGAVTVGIGDNRWFGGMNESSSSWIATSVSATVKLDSKTIIDRGKLVL